MYSGTLIEDLIAVVQRAEQAAQLDQEQAPGLLAGEGLLAASEETAAYNLVPITRDFRVMGANSDLRGVA